MKSKIGLVLVLAFVVGLVAVARDLEGVSLPNRSTVGEKELVLNGMGVRVKKVAFIGIKVYVAGLYLPAKQSDPVKILATDEPRQLVMHFLYREVGKDKLVEGWTEGFQKNSPDKVASLKADIDRFNALWTDMKTGDRAVLTYQPGVGTKVEIKGMEAGTFAGREFADALFAIWLGPQPPNADLKTGLLGQ